MRCVEFAGLVEPLGEAVAGFYALAIEVIKN
jgi:hypothetical protein